MFSQFRKTTFRFVNQVSTKNKSSFQLMNSKKINETLHKAGFSDKYINIRNRFLQNFYFSGYIASEIKTSDNSQDRNKITYVKFSDQTIYAGLALLNFSCESQILRINKLDNRQSEYLIKETLFRMKFDESDGPHQLALNGRDIYSGNQPGFLIRDSIHNDTHDRKILRIPENAKLDSDFMNDITLKNGDAAPSQDQLAHVLVGLWAVATYSESSRCKQAAEQLAIKILLLLAKNAFIIYYPNEANGKIEVPRGANARLMSSFFNIVSNKLGGPSFYRDEVPGLDLIFDFIASICFSGITIEVEEIQTLTQDIFNDTDRFVTSLLDQLGYANPCRIPIKKAALKLIDVAKERFENARSFEAHLMLVVAALHEGIDFSKFASKSLKFNNNHVWAPLLKAIVEKKQVSIPEIAEELAACPDEGPSNIKKSSWWKDNRWIRSKDILDPYQKGDSQYNGLDYLNIEVMHNLTHTFFKPNKLTPEENGLFSTKNDTSLEFTSEGNNSGEKSEPRIEPSYYGVKV